MTDQIVWQYQLDCGAPAFKAVVHARGRMKRTWAGCKLFHLEPEGEDYFLLTSPFIERFTIDDFLFSWRQSSIVNVCGGIRIVSPQSS
jgi:hypothetical protein